MEGSIKREKIEAMKSYKRAKFVYNFVLYSLTSIITCFFFSYPFWFPSMNHFLSYLPNNFSFFLNAKCFFVLGNLIVVILVGESKLKQSSSSSTSDIYDDYFARIRGNHQNVNPTEMSGYTKSFNIEEKKHEKEDKIYQEGKKKEVRACKSSMPHNEGKRRGMRTSKSAVWGESGIVKREKTKLKKEEEIYNHEEKKMGMRSCKSEIWGESEIVKREKTKGKKEEEIYKSGMNHEEQKMGMRSCKSEIWDETEIVRREKTKGKKEEEIYKSGMNHEEQKMGMRSCKSEIWGESEIVKREKTKGKKEEEIFKSSMNHEEQKMGMRSCRSEIWREDEIVKREKTKEKDEEQLFMPCEELNRRVEAFIARVNKQRLLEAKLIDDGRG